MLASDAGSCDSKGGVHYETKLMGRIAIGAILMIAAAAPVRSGSIRDDVTFSTTGQALFGANQGQADATKTIPFGTTPLFQDSRGPVTEGEIYHLDQDLPVETTQAIWQAAINACRTQITRTQNISIPVLGTHSCRGSVTPTESQCINGGTINPTLTATCCVGSGTYPNCQDILFAPDTVTVSTDKLSFNVGPGIGPKPTTGTTRPYDVGFIATVRSDVEVGIEGELVLDAGSVDVEYPTSFELETSADQIDPGQVFRLTARHVPGAAALTSEYPNITFALKSYSKVNVRVDVEYAGINYDNGNQIRATVNVDAFDTSAQPDADDQGRIVNDIIEVKAGLGAGLQVRVNTDVAVGGVEAKLLDPIDPFVLPIEFPFDITNPPKPAPFCEVVPRPECNFNPPISTDIVEMLFRVPFLDTPAFPGFNGGNDFTGVAGEDVPIEQARNELLADGSIRNTTITGKRDALQSSLEAVGGDLTKLSIDDGIVDTDLVRLGVDIDGSLTGFGLPPGGADLQLPPQLPANFFIEKLAGKRLLEVEANLIDLDAVDYLYFDQEIVFRPNLKVELVFDKAVQVRSPELGPGFFPVTLNSNGEFAVEVPVRPDLAAVIDVIQPQGGVVITPRYSIEDNLFENNLDWLINTGIQGTVGQIVLGGYIVAIAGPVLTGVSDLESFNFALGQFQPTFDEPIRIPAHDHFSLGGFGDPVAGTAIMVRATGASPSSATRTPTIAGGSQTPGAGFTPTVTGTPTPSPSPTITPTPTALVTNEDADLNCDGHPSAADLVDFVFLAEDPDSVACPEADADLDRNGVVDATDVALLIQRVFDALPAP